MATNQSNAKRRFAGQLLKGGLFIFRIFFAAGFGIIFGFLVLWFPASMLFCFLLFRFSLLLCFSAFKLYLLLFFSDSLLSLLLCFSAFVFLRLSTSTSLLFFPSVMCFCCSTSCSSGSLLLCLYCLLLFVFSFALFSPVCKHPRWNPKKP